jgi:hypothetical protein
MDLFQEIIRLLGCYPEINASIMPGILQCVVADPKLSNCRRYQASGFSIFLNKLEETIKNPGVFKFSASIPRSVPFPFMSASFAMKSPGKLKLFAMVKYY